MTDNYKHLLLEVLIYLGELQRRLTELDKLTEKDSVVNKDKITSYSVDSLRMLHALDPCLEDAKKEYPQFIEFITSCQAALAKIKIDLKIKPK